MTYEEAKTCKQHLELLKAEIEWDKPIEYQVDLDLAIESIDKQIQVEADGCSECKYISKDEFEQPCLLCKRSKKDYWKRSDEE